ncbi:hypothetical protein B296_00015580 [Ensete ventricosum]|uniref:Uncharacterized protein n=1 Tax=Ensete ventricosum TaxID=4639 RepID=A0A427AV80_ENSVE|nr:hypothetical protein B296_00015580 [Ensete ventricosum]
MLGEVAKTVKAAVGVVEKVAEVTVEISKDVAEALPENTKLKQVVLEVEEIAQVVDEEAKLAETILKEVSITAGLVSRLTTIQVWDLSVQVDSVVEKVDTLVEPIVDELEGGEGEVTRQGKDSKTTI